MRVVAAVRESIDLPSVASRTNLQVPGRAGDILILWKGEVDDRVPDIITAIPASALYHLCAVYVHDEIVELLWDSFGPPAGYETEYEV